MLEEGVELTTHIESTQVIDSTKRQKATKRRKRQGFGTIWYISLSLSGEPICPSGGTRCLVVSEWSTIGPECVDMRRPQMPTREVGLLDGISNGIGGSNRAPTTKIPVPHQFFRLLPHWVQWSHAQISLPPLARSRDVVRLFGGRSRLPHPTGNAGELSGSVGRELPPSLQRGPPRGSATEVLLPVRSR